MCKKCDINYAYESPKSLKLHNRRSHKIIVLNKINTITNDTMLNTENIDNATNDRYFLDLQKEEKWIAFYNNLNYLKKKTENSLQHCAKTKLINSQ